MGALGFDTMGKRFAVVKNRNRKDLPVEWLYMLGGSDERNLSGGLTGQGIGFKYTALLMVSRGLRLIRSSHDENGQYIAEYGRSAMTISGRSDHDKAVLKVTRPARQEQLIETTMLIRMSESAWSQSPMGESYPIVREAILDAVDEDPRFQVDFVDKIDYAPIGETWTYIELNGGLREVFDSFRYYFKRQGDLRKVSDGLAIAEKSSDKETRLFIGDSKATFGYVAWTTGEYTNDRTPAFDYVLLENSETQWASLPKRIVEDVSRAMSHISTQMMEHATQQDLASFVAATADNSKWESTLPAVNVYGRRRDVLGAAIKTAFGGRPIHTSGADAFAVEANESGISFAVVPDGFFEAFKNATANTLKNVVAVRDPNQEYLTTMVPADRRILDEAIAHLEEHWPDVDFVAGHLIMRMECDNNTLARHIPNYAGKDVYGICFNKFHDPIRLARTIVHEYGHHIDDHTDQGYWHGRNYIDGLLSVLVGA